MPPGSARFVYDGDRLVEEYDGNGNRPRVYVHGQGADEPLVWYELIGGPVHRFYHADRQGSIVALADDYGNALAINGYDAWGIPNAGNAGRFQYTGQAWIAELGMYYYKARIYSPTLGRFMQTDPIGYDDQINLYAYVGNDPMNHSDPTGLSCTYNADGKTVTCKIDKVLVGTDKTGNKVYREPRPSENKRFAAFNREYTRSVNRLLSHPNRPATVAAIKGGQGSFKTTAGRAAEALISRQFAFYDKAQGNTAMQTDGGPGLGREATTFVRPLGLLEGGMGIVHDGGLHGTPEEFTRGLQTLEQPLGQPAYEHQKQYNKAACELLGASAC